MMIGKLFHCKELKTRYSLIDTHLRILLKLISKTACFLYEIHSIFVAIKTVICFNYKNKTINIMRKQHYLLESRAPPV